MNIVQWREREDLLSLFPGFEKIYDGDDHSYEKLAVSVFDHRLGIDNLGLLDCKTVTERRERNKKFSLFCEKLFDNTILYALSYENEQYIIKKFLDKESFINYCDCGNQDKSWSDFYFLFIPEYRVIYHENRDDTNVFFFKDRADVIPLLPWVEESGLHTIEFAQGK